MTDSATGPSPSPLRIALVYAALAGLWIVFSDQAFEWLFGIPAKVTLANMLKGWTFVIITALSLYVLLSYRNTKPVDEVPLIGRHGILPTLALLVTVITGLTLGIILNTLEHRRDIDLASVIGWIALTGALTLFATASALLLSRQRQKTLIAQKIAQSQNERLRALHLLAAIADSSSEVIFAKDMENRFILFNRASEALTGKTQAEVLGLDESALVPPELAQRQMADNRKVMDDNITLNIQEEVAFLGDKRTFLTTKGPLHDSEGKVIGLYGISRDITERSKMETALREREASFRMLTEQIPAIIYRANLDELSQTIYISPRVQELGYTPEEWLAQPDIWVQSLHPEDLPRVLAELEAFQTKGGVLSLEYRIRTRAGEWRYFQDEAEALHNEAGQPLYLQGVMLDVTARHEIEAELDSVHSHANMLVELLNHSSQAFVQGFADGRLGYHNPAFLDLVGYTEEEFSKINWATDLTPPEWLDMEMEKLAELHRTGKSVVYEKEYLRKDGSRVPIELLVHLIRDENGLPKHYYAFITDISERKQSRNALQRQTEELRRHNEELERFNRATVGREMDMIRLKQQINEMALRLGDVPPYELGFLDESDQRAD